MSEHPKNESQQAHDDIAHNVKRTAEGMQAAFVVAIAVALVATAALFLTKMG